MQFERFDMSTMLTVERVDRSTIRSRLRNHTKFANIIQDKNGIFVLITVSSRGDDSNRYPQHMVLWRNLEIYHILSF